MPHTVIHFFRAIQNRGSILRNGTDDTGMTRTKNFADVIRLKLAANPDLAETVELEEFHADVAQEIHDARIAVGLTQKQLACLARQSGPASTSGPLRILKCHFRILIDALPCARTGEAGRTGGQELSCRGLDRTAAGGKDVPAATFVSAG